jgi:lipopolysaccharide/colanic/teichoic acid biosynthesis glycosyltransferase
MARMSVRLAARLLEVSLALSALSLAMPILLLSAAGILIASPGPVLYRASRIGKYGRPFCLYKLRTMHVAASGPPITAHDDPRIFRLGRFLRRSKLDEVPQLWNVVRGDMALVGPRPEDPAIVAEYYTEAERRTLMVRPGITSPGTLYYFALGESLVEEDDPIASYVGKVLRTKLALDLAYLDEASLHYDLALICRTAQMIARKVIGRGLVPHLPELSRYQVSANR